MTGRFSAPGSVRGWSRSSSPPEINTRSWWVNPNHGSAPAARGSDGWGGYAAERRQIADFIADAITNLLMLSGDGHMLAIDDGSNSNYSTHGEGGFPSFHLASIGAPPSRAGRTATAPARRAASSAWSRCETRAPGQSTWSCPAVCTQGAEVLRYEFRARAVRLTRDARRALRRATWHLSDRGPRSEATAFGQELGDRRLRFPRDHTWQFACRSSVT